MERRLQALTALGIPTEFHHYPGLRHGFGLGTGTVAEGWLDQAVAFGRPTPAQVPPDVTAAGASRQKALSLQLANPISTRRGPFGVSAFSFGAGETTVNLWVRAP